MASEQIFTWVSENGINRINVAQVDNDHYSVMLSHGPTSTIVRLDLDTMAALVRSLVRTEPLRSKLESRV